jgi:hypothetical protein
MIHMAVFGKRKWSVGKGAESLVEFVASQCRIINGVVRRLRSTAGQADLLGDACPVGGNVLSRGLVRCSEGARASTMLEPFKSWQELASKAHWPPRMRQEG